MPDSKPFQIAKFTIVTDKLEFQNNHLPRGQYQLHPQIVGKITKVNATNFFDQIEVHVASSETMKFPFDLHVVMRILYEFRDIQEEKQIFEYLKKDAMQTLYAYVRSQVSQTTLMAGFPPLSLPILEPSSFTTENIGSPSPYYIQ